jgi:hypothetical protein
VCVLLAFFRDSDKSNGVKMCGVYCTGLKLEMHTILWLKNLKRKAHLAGEPQKESPLGGPRCNGRVILKCMLGTQCVNMLTGFIWAALDHLAG